MKWNPLLCNKGNLKEDDRKQIASNYFYEDFITFGGKIDQIEDNNKDLIVDSSKNDFTKENSDQDFLYQSWFNPENALISFTSHFQGLDKPKKARKNKKRITKTPKRDRSGSKWLKTKLRKLKSKSSHYVDNIPALK